jgi:CRP-like cAMP-binding protein
MGGKFGSAVLGSPLFGGLEAAAVDEVLAAAGRRAVPAGSELFHQGDRVEALYLLESGRLRLTQVTRDGEEIALRSFGPGSILAGVALFDRRDFPVTATAEGDCEVLVWPRARAQELAARHPALRANVVATIADRMQDTLSRIRELSAETVPQRVARALLRLARESGRRVPAGILIDQPLGRRELAELAGGSMFTISRLVAAWAREGILEVGRQRIVVRSPERLLALAEQEGEVSPSLR